MFHFQPNVQLRFTEGDREYFEEWDSLPYHYQIKEMSSFSEELIWLVEESVRRIDDRLHSAEWRYETYSPYRDNAANLEHDIGMQMLQIRAGYRDECITFLVLAGLIDENTAQDVTQFCFNRESFEECV